MFQVLDSTDSLYTSSARKAKWCQPVGMYGMQGASSAYTLGGHGYHQKPDLVKRLKGICRVKRDMHENCGADLDLGR